MAMKPLNIGDRVRVHATCSFGYDENEERRLFVDSVAPFDAIVTGQKRKQLGKYQHGSSGAYTGGGYEPPDPEPPYLRVTGTVLVWCVRKTLSGRELLVADGNLEKLP